MSTMLNEEIISNMDIDINKTESFLTSHEPQCIADDDVGSDSNTRLSTESHDVDSNHSSSTTCDSEATLTTEPIAKNFESIHIDPWKDRFNMGLGEGEERNSLLKPRFPCLLTDVEIMADDFVIRPTNKPEDYRDPEDYSNMQVVLYAGPPTIAEPCIIENEFNKDENVEDSSALPGSCGLQNLGNTCYMNSGLQCLFATPHIVQYFLPEIVFTTDESSHATYISSDILNARTGDKSGILTQDFAQLLLKIWSGKYSLIYSKEFKLSFGSRYTPFKDNMQHDCQEFLALLLDGLHENLNSIGTCGNNSKVIQDNTMIAGCSKQIDQISCSPIKSTTITSPNGKSNILAALQLTNKKNAEVEKNHLALIKDCNKPLLVEENHTSPATSPCNNNNNILGGGGTSENLDIKDIIKCTKTSNVNMLCPITGECPPNNKLKFDSEKYGTSSRLFGTTIMVSPRSMKYLSVRDAVLVKNQNNLNENGEKEEACSLLEEPVQKKLKQTNLKQGSDEPMEDVIPEIDDDTDLKKPWVDAPTTSFEKLKAMSSLIKNKEENASYMDYDMDFFGDENEIDLSQQEAADKHWDQLLSVNNSIIIDTFQGQLSNTIVCNVCNFKSITFEPFMSLPLTLPQAMELQLEVTFVPANPCEPAVKFLVTLNRTTSVEKLREEIRELTVKDKDIQLQICESLESRISKLLNPNDELEKAPKDRSIYVIELPKTTASDDNVPEPEVGDMEVPTIEAFFKNSDSTVENDLPWPKCNVCLEDIDLNLKPLRHSGDCICVLCDECFQECKIRQLNVEESFKCPLCHRIVDADNEFIVITSIDSRCKPCIWHFPVPIVFRVDEEGEEYNNRRTTRLYGHPRLLILPNKITGAELYQILTPYAVGNSFTLLQVGGNGLICSNCMYNSHCKGCTISSSSDEIVELHANAMIAVRTKQPLNEVTFVIEHDSMKSKRIKEVLSIHDCLTAFTKPETLDESNPWFCPNCKLNQCATKIMKVLRYPPVLIIYLKRFMYHEGRSVKLHNKVTFPLEGLYLKEAGKQTGNYFDLYSCVCHTGGVCGSGHYIAYAKHPQSNDLWFKYNDDNVTKQRPQEEDYNLAYVLFYKKVTSNSSNM